MRKNRDRLRILTDLLEAAGTGKSKTRIMFAANLSFKLLVKYLGTALGLGFVKANGSGYELTKQGKAFLDRYRHFNNKYFQVQKAFEELTGEMDELERLCEEPREYSDYEPD